MNTTGQLQGYSAENEQFALAFKQVVLDHRIQVIMCTLGLLLCIPKLRMSPALISEDLLVMTVEAGLGFYDQSLAP